MWGIFNLLFFQITKPVAETITNTKIPIEYLIKSAKIWASISFVVIKTSGVCDGDGYTIGTIVLIGTIVSTGLGVLLPPFGSGVIVGVGFKVDFDVAVIDGVAVAILQIQSTSLEQIGFLQ